MAVHGYVDVPHSDYAQWKLNTLGEGYDLDGYYGCQCWDFASLFWRNVGFPAGYPLTGPNISAYECWTVSRIQNAGTQFDLITDVTQIKTGDVIVLGPTSQNPAGHIAFANEDYRGNMIVMLGQNQGGTPTPSGGSVVSISNVSLSEFLGAFRYKEWHQPVPPTPTTTKKSKFKWVLYANKLRAKH